jgi:hypothetical protein
MERNGYGDDWLTRAVKNIAYAEEVAARRYGEEAAARAGIAAVRYVYRGGPLAKQFADREQAVRLVCWRARRQLYTLHMRAQRERPAEPGSLDRGAEALPPAMLDRPPSSAVDGAPAVEVIWAAVARHFLAARGKLDKPELKVLCWRLRIVEGYSNRDLAKLLADQGYLAGDTSEENEATLRQWFSRTAPRLRVAWEAARRELGLD